MRNTMKPEQQKEREANEVSADVQRKKASKALASLLCQFKGRYSILQLLPLIKNRYPSLLAFAIERVEEQRRRNELSITKIVELERFKASLEQEG